MRLVDQVGATRSGLRTVWVDGDYRQHLIEHAATGRIGMEIVQRTAATSFAPLPRRWTVERTLGWLMFHRRLVRDYEALPPAEAMIHPDRVHEHAALLHAPAAFWQGFGARGQLTLASPRCMPWRWR
ncbi:hypothetical protein [Streptomyces canus]|uniref:hypothetical protein n=1 Tax=Streptomyces canus TaxID=58343 RepID=UPI003CFA18AB